MSDLTLLRQIVDAQPALSDERFATMRARLLSDVEGTASPVPRRGQPARRRAAPVSVAVLAAAGVAIVAVLLVTVFGLGGVAKPQTASAEALNRAATATIRVHDPVVGSGQYLHVQTTYSSSVVEVRDTGGDLAWLIRGMNDEWVPGDPDGTWVQRRGVGVPFKFFSAAAKHEALTNGPIDDQPVTVEGKNGIYAPTAQGSLPPWTPTTLKALPHEPTQLLAALAHRQGIAPSDHALMFEALTDILKTGFAPAQLRATIYRAIVTIPAVSITDRSATLDGRTGVAIGRTDPSTGTRLDLIIDTHDGLVIGLRSVLTRAYHGMPAGTVQSFTAVRTSVADFAPTTK